MQTYYLATNLFALTALLLGLETLTAKRNQLLWPLFLLVISRSLSLIATFIFADYVMLSPLLNALTFFETWCIIWIIGSPLVPYLKRPQALQWGTVGGLGLSLLPLGGGSVLLYNLLLIGVGFGMLLQQRELQLTNWPHIATLLALLMTSLLTWFGFSSTAGLSGLLTYVFLIQALFSHLSSEMGPGPLKDGVLPPTEVAWPAQRNLPAQEVKDMLSALSNPEQFVKRIADYLVQLTHVDQLAIFLLDEQTSEQARLATFHNLNRPSPPPHALDLVLKLQDYPSLKEAIESQQPLMLPQSNKNGLQSLYDLWDEPQIGPTLLQPLSTKEQTVGVLLIGNPTSKRPISEVESALCQKLAPQIATIIENYHWNKRRWVEEQESTKEADVGAAEYQGVINNMAEGVVVSNAKGRVQFVNKSAEQILGKARRELLGQPIGTLYGQIDSREKIENLAQTFSRQNKPIPTYLETDTQSIKGKLLPWRSQEREWLGIIAIFEDVTQEVESERAKNEFVRALSHELRSPLTVIKGYSDLIANGTFGDYSLQQQEVHQVIYGAVNRAVELLDNVAHMGMYGQVTSATRFQKVDLKPIIERAVETARPAMNTHKQTLELSFQNELPEISANANHIRKVLENLLANACQFTPQGGKIALTVSSHSKRFGTLIRPEVVIEISDTGIGIPEIEQRRIFEPFYQVRERQEHKGLGMGLAVVKELVQLHNGRVWVESKPNEGATFRVALPLRQS